VRSPSSAAGWWRRGRKCERNDFHGVGNPHRHGEILPPCLCVRDGESGGRPGQLNLRDDAYMLASLAADLHVTQAVDATKGVHASLPKSIFASR